MSRSGEVARAYHEATRLSPTESDHVVVDWSDQPRPYKRYRDLPRTALPRQLHSSRTPALAALAVGGSPAAGEADPTTLSPDGRLDPGSLDLATLATVLHHSAGIVRRLRHGRGTMLFRAASCTGALYHIELYVVTGPLADLTAGAYHFDVSDFTLGTLRAGDLRGALAAASAVPPGGERAPALLICTSVFARNAWRYGERAYRHAFWDCGTILANLLGMAAAHGLATRVATGFVDRDVNHLLGVDGAHEAALAVVALGEGGPLPDPVAEAPPPINFPTIPSARQELDYPLIQSMHAASALDAPEAVAAWRRGISTQEDRLAPDADPGAAPRTPLPESEPSTDSALSGDPLEAVIARRGSARRFAPGPIDLDTLTVLLLTATATVPLDVLGGAVTTLNDVYLIVQDVDGLLPGAYVLDRGQRALRLLRGGAFREAADTLTVSKGIACAAAVNVYFMADLDRVAQRFGERGYRAAQLEAGIQGGRLYLATYALGLAATGLTFYDDEVTEFFGSDGRRQSAMFLVALGRPARLRPAAAAATGSDAVK